MPRKKKEAATATALGLKIVAAGGIAHGGFRWPLEVGAVVTAPDWSPAPECGGGLHFWPRGEGDVSTCPGHDAPGAVGIAIEYDPATAIDLGGKSKVPRCTVAFAGSVREAAAWVAARVVGARVIYGTATAGYAGTATSGYGGTSTSGDGGTSTSGTRGTSTSGDGGTSTSGDGGTSTSGYGGTSTSGDGGTSTSGYGGTSTSGYGGTSTSGYGGTSTSGYGGTATSGDRGTSTSGDRGTATAGYAGTATAGHHGTATSGDRGTSTSGYGGTSTSGDRGTSTSGDRGTATAGDSGSISIMYYDRKIGVYRRRVAECDAAGPVKPWRRYSLDADGQWVDKGEVPVSERPAAVLAAALAKAKK